MGVRDITAGDKLAKPLAMRFIKSEKKGTPGVEIAFQFEEPSTGNPETLNWVGWLSEKAIENTMDTLVSVLGYNGSKATDAEGVFTDAKVLNFDKEVKLVVELEQAMTDDGMGNMVPKLDDNGQPQFWPRIKWVNSVGGSMYAVVAPEVVKSEFAKIGFEAAFLAAKQSSAKPGSTTPPAPPAKPKDLPF